MMKVVVRVDEKLSSICWIKRVPGFGAVPYEIMFSNMVAKLWKISKRGIIYYRL